MNSPDPPEPILPGGECDADSGFDEIAADVRHGAAYFTFEVCGKIFAIPATKIGHIGPRPKPHRIPRRNVPVEGIVNIQGGLIPCVSLPSLFELPTSCETDWMFVFRRGDMHVACGISAARTVAQVSDDSWIPLAQSIASTHPCVRAFADLEGERHFCIDEGKLADAIREALR